jgi:tRNA1Val (adenine37-N6)-methyltransferase
MSIFRFQQFAVRQTDSAMKVCTDATLFGAMAPLQGGERVLDIGTGTGLLAMMAMQLGAARATGVELTTQAYAEARCEPVC